MKRRMFLSTPLILSACGGGGGSDDGPADVASPYTIGPVDYPGGNPSFGYSQGYDTIDIPQPSSDRGHVHYVTMPCKSLLGADGLQLSVRVELADGHRLVPVKAPAAKGLLTPYFQREGDDYTERCEAYRWWCKPRTWVDPRGSINMLVLFDDNWTAVLRSSRESNRRAYDDALFRAHRVGFTLGGGDGLGHGVYATGPCRLVINKLEVL